MLEVNTGSMHLVYEDQEGNHHYQSWQDVVEVGTLIDPEDGDDMQIIGWVRDLEDKPLDVWLRLYPDDEDGLAELEANTYKTDDGYVVEWYHNDVGLVTKVHFDTLEDAHKWYEQEGFQDFSS